MGALSLCHHQVSETSRGRSSPRDGGHRGGGGAVRGRSQRSFHNRGRSEEDDDEDGDDLEEEEEEEDLAGSDSDNDDTMSVMDPDAMRAAMATRGRVGSTGRVTGGRGWRGGDDGGGHDGRDTGPSEYVVEFEVSRGVCCAAARDTGGVPVRTDRLCCVGGGGECMLGCSVLWR